MTLKTKNILVTKNTFGNYDVKVFVLETNLTKK